MLLCLGSTSFYGKKDDTFLEQNKEMKIRIKRWVLVKKM